MNRQKVLKWTPRVLSVSFTIFIGIFALDVFSEGYSLFELAIALFMHSIPTIFFAFVTYISWKNPKSGGIIFIVLSILTIFAFDTYEQPLSFFTITMIPLLTGVLFMFNERE
ncbi:MAG: hypothetical protein JW922_01795 [Paludibacteraceae bacterium]|nr:hypothetical protein [Paludibacteraceae bacterium]